MKNSGFTLIELIAIIAIMGTMMLVSIPNINSMIDKRKRSAYLEDAKKMVELAEYKFETKVLKKKPSSSRCKVYTLRQLDKTELSTPPNNGEYDLDRSFVVIEYKNPYYVYSVQLVEKYDVNTGINKSKTMYRGITYVSSKELDYENSKMKCVSAAQNSLNKFNDLNTYCPSWKRV